MSLALMVMNWMSFSFLEEFNQRDLEWLVIGAALTVAIMWVISRRKRRWL
jgi:hypothetical protein